MATVVTTSAAVCTIVGACRDLREGEAARVSEPSHLECDAFGYQMIVVSGHVEPTEQSLVAKFGRDAAQAMLSWSPDRDSDLSGVLSASSCLEARE